MKTKIEVEETIGMENPYYYRNKAQFPFGFDANNNKAIGVFANRTHEIIPFQKCFIQNQTAVEIAKFVFEYIKENNISIYNEGKNTGVFRHIIIKTGFKSNEIMCIFVINERLFSQEKDLVEKLVKQFPNIKTIVKNINSRNTNVIMGNKNINLYGDGYIYDNLDEYTFKISPMSFYQTNPQQTEVLYNLVAKEIEKDNKDKILFDLYCGIGTISIFLAKYVKQVYGIEIVEMAIKDAKENCKLNKIENAEFIEGDVEKELSRLIHDKNIKSDIIVVDPPRKGLDETTVKNLLEIKSEKIIYISCNPATLVRDLSGLEETYNIKSMQPVDMFPFTHHVECLTILSLKNQRK